MCIDSDRLLVSAGPREVLTSGWWGGEKKRTQCCLSKKEGPNAVGALITVLMAGADAGGDSDFQLDAEEFHSMMEFLKVVLVRGHKGLKKQTGVDRMMTQKVFTSIIEKTVESMRAETQGFLTAEQRAAMTDLDEDGEGDDDLDYAGMTIRELKEECKDRGLKTKGNKQQALIDQLEEFDADADADEPEDSTDDEAEQDEDEEDEDEDEDEESDEGEEDEEDGDDDDDDEDDEDTEDDSD